MLDTGEFYTWTNEYEYDREMFLLVLAATILPDSHIYAVCYELAVVCYNLTDFKSFLVAFFFEEKTCSFIANLL